MRQNILSLVSLFIAIVSLLIVITATSSSKTWCQEKVQSILSMEEWRSVHLDELHRIQVELNEHLKSGNIKAIEGHSGSGDVAIERQIYYSIASLSPCIRRICEIGFNAGHSTLEWLIAAPHADIVSFDLFSHTYSNLSEKFIKSHPSLNATPRFELYRGDSTIIVPEYASSHKGVLCDILSIDGGHTYDIASRDIINMKPLANPEFHVLFIDDTNCRGSHCVDRAVNDMINRSVIARVENGTFSFGYRGSRGLSLLKYIQF